LGSAALAKSRFYLAYFLTLFTAWGFFLQKVGKKIRRLFFRPVICWHQRPFFGLAI